MTDHTLYMKHAIAQAKQAKTDGELPFGAVVVRGDEIIATGRCREMHEQTVLAHAELEAVDDACRKLATNKLVDCIIYCTNEPCPMCAAAIFQAKIPRVVMGLTRDDLPFLRPRAIDIQTLADDSGYPIEITRGVMKEEILALFGERL